jgi:uncharacterized protein
MPAHERRAMLRILRRMTIIIVLTVLTLYLGATATLYALQRTILFAGAGGPAIPLPPADSPYRPWTIDLPGGQSLLLWRGKPSAKGMPVVVFFHGNGSQTSDFAELGERFQARGWGVVLAAYRGYSGNAGSPSETSVMEDARAILTALGDPGGPIILWGHSLGSGVAARMAAEGRGAALVLEAPYTSVANLAAQRYPIFPVRLLIRDPFDTQALVPLINVPVLVFHSDDDPVIPVAMGRAMVAALGPRATPEMMSGLGHNPHAADLSPIVAKWLDAQGLLPPG